MNPPPAPPSMPPEQPSIPPSMPASSSDDKLWIILSHLSIFFGLGFFLPLVVYFVKKQDSPVLADQVKEILNFHISLFIYYFISILLCFILVGFLFIFALVIITIIFPIMGCMKASEGLPYRYPLTIRMF